MDKVFSRHYDNIMPRIVPVEDLITISNVMALFPSGASINDLMKCDELKLPKRTLQRRLDHLIGKQRLLAQGQGRARKYLLPSTPTKTKDPKNAPPSGPHHLSVETIRIRAALRRPLSERTPVGYQSSFLGDYVPNQTHYLSTATRKLLLNMGQVGLTDLPAGTYLRQVLHRLLIDLSWNSSRLEGNTYTLLETKRLLEVGADAEGRAAKETQMILNHKAAIEMLADQAEGVGFNRYTICNLHALLSDNLLSDSTACGLLRSRPVGISGTVFQPLEVPQLIEQRFDQMLSKTEAIRDPFEQAFFVMVHLPYLQPFEDVNKRVSRLAANIPLMRHNLCPLSFVDVELDDYVGGVLAVYELNRVEYLRDVFVWAYRRSCARYAAVRQSLGDPDPFRLRHRSAIGEVVRLVVQGCLGKADAARCIEQHATSTIPGEDRQQFMEVVMKELSTLHPGSIMRYRLRPSEFEAWKFAWQ